MTWTRTDIGTGLLLIVAIGTCLVAGIVIRNAFTRVDYDQIDARNAIAKVVPDFDSQQAEYNRTSSGFVVTFRDRTIILDCYKGTDGLLLVKDRGCNVSLVKITKPAKSEASP